MAGGNNGDAKDGSKSGINLMDTLIAPILSEKTGLNLTESGPSVADLKKMMADFSVGPVNVENNSANLGHRSTATSSTPVS